MSCGPDASSLVRRCEFVGGPSRGLGHERTGGVCPDVPPVSQTATTFTPVPGNDLARMTALQPTRPARPHGRPQRRLTERASAGPKRFAVTSAENEYDYACQEPVNGFDLDGAKMYLGDEHASSAGGIVVPGGGPGGRGVPAGHGGGGKSRDILAEIADGLSSLTGGRSLQITLGGAFGGGFVCSFVIGDWQVGCGVSAGLDREASITFVRKKHAPGCWARGQASVGAGGISLEGSIEARKHRGATSTSAVLNPFVGIGSKAGASIDVICYS
jgi:hypothetical protein